MAPPTPSTSAMTAPQVRSGSHLPLRDAGLVEREGEALALKLGAVIGEDADARVPVAVGRQDDGVGDPVDRAVRVRDDVGRVLHARQLFHPCIPSRTSGTRGRAAVVEPLEGELHAVDRDHRPRGVHDDAVHARPPRDDLHAHARGDLAEGVGERLDRNAGGLVDGRRRGQRGAHDQHGRTEHDLHLEPRREAVEPAPHAPAVEVVQPAERQRAERQGRLHDQRPPVLGADREDAAGLDPGRVRAGHRHEADRHEREGREPRHGGAHRERRGAGDPRRAQEQQEQPRHPAEPDADGRHVDDAGQDRHEAGDGRRVSGGDEQDDPDQAGGDGRRPSPARRPPQQERGAQRGDRRARQLQQAGPAVDQVRRPRAGSHARGQRGDEGGDGRDGQAGREQLDQAPRHRALAQHEPMEGRQTDGRQQPDVRQPATDDADDVRIAVHLVGRCAGQVALDLADAEVEEALGDVTVCRGEAAPGDRVDPVVQVRAATTSAWGSSGSTSPARSRIGVPSRAFEVERGDLLLERLAEHEAQLVRRLGQDGARCR